MPHLAVNGVHLWVEETGAGPAMLFLHEFGGDHRSWHRQIEYFERTHRCIAYAVRGFPPSDVPEDAAAYRQDTAPPDPFRLPPPPRREEAGPPEVEDRYPIKRETCSCPDTGPRATCQQMEDGVVDLLPPARRSPEISRGSVHGRGHRGRSVPNSRARSTSHLLP